MKQDDPSDKIGWVGVELVFDLLGSRDDCMFHQNFPEKYLGTGWGIWHFDLILQDTPSSFQLVPTFPTVKDHKHYKIRNKFTKSYLGSKGDNPTFRTSIGEYDNDIDWYLIDL